MATNTITVIGSASGKTLLHIPISSDGEENELSLMEILLQHNIPIAYSCRGDGICKKCKVFIDEIEVLACQKSPQNLFSKESSVIIKLTYL